MSGLDRRTFLRGALGGVAVTVGLPLFDGFLNGNGTALASGAPLPLRFGTWFWGCGMNPGRWNPNAVGAGYELGPELQPIAGVQQHVTVLSGFSVHLDGRPNHPHKSGVIGTLTGEAPAKSKDVPAPTLDVLISDEVGSSTRFRSLELTATGSAKDSYSLRGQSVMNSSETSPIELYRRVFGSGFQDPNAAGFVPDPEVMLRQSVVSAVKDDRKRLETQLGTHDRQRLDDYLTALRQLERQLELQLSAPPPLEACQPPGAPAEGRGGSEVGHAEQTHELMTKLLVMALACDQTRVFNMVFSYGASNLHLPGSQTGHHQLTHEEQLDAKLGYQPRASYFVDRSMETWAAFVHELAAFPEGDGSLLDNSVVMAHSETSFAKIHDVLGLPIMLAGRAGGRIQPGIHVTGAGDPVTRVGLTLQQIMGVSVDRWGSGSMETNRAISEIFA
ncbi:MAG: DUF1552 domain-containing protein [Myxococcota bacterium]|nr:DUF1552 domain-containing protein [Myxococcota bacterium]